jgi:hypothetical protein
VPLVRDRLLAEAVRTSRALLELAVGRPRSSGMAWSPFPEAILLTPHLERLFRQRARLRRRPR